MEPASRSPARSSTSGLPSQASGHPRGGPHGGIAAARCLQRGTGKPAKLLVNGQARDIKLDKPLTWQAGHIAAEGYKSRPTR